MLSWRSELTPAEDHFQRAQATMILEFTHWAHGDLEGAQRAMTDWIDSMQKAGNLVFVIASAFALADILIAEGHLREAMRTYQQSIELASAQDQDAQRITAHHHLGLAMLYHEMDDQEAAAQHLQRARELGEQTTLVDWPYRWRIAQAQLKEAGGDLDAALDLLDEAKRAYVRNPIPDTRPIEALKARVYLRQGRLTQALAWAHEHGLAGDDDLSYLGEFEHIVLARVLIAEHRDGAPRAILEAMGLLDRLLQAAEAGRRLGSVIEILLVQALAHQEQGNTSLALASLQRALALAEPEGYVRIFVDEGESMARLLQEEPRRGIAPDYTGRILAAEPAPPQSLARSIGHRAFPNLAVSPATQSKTPDPRPNMVVPRIVEPEMVEPLVEPLSPRELEILQLIAQGLSNHAICERLFLALSTVKGYNQRIFEKLQVQSRTEAVARARELGLL